jgi:hypothetical protein
MYECCIGFLGAKVEKPTPSSRVTIQARVSVVSLGISVPILHQSDSTVLQALQVGLCINQG